jgi:glycosyltransferase involved in cell wall biosynthesis
MKENYILTDGRWLGDHGIGRFSTEIIKRLKHTDILTGGPKPLSNKNFFWLPYQLSLKKQDYRVFYSPGFNPVIYSPIPFVFTICDLIHLHFPGNLKFAKNIYYNFIIKPAARRAHTIITISEFSKKTIMDWANLPEDKVKVVGCGVSASISNVGNKYQPGYPYLLHVGNTKPHKNVERLLLAFSMARIDPKFKLILTGTPTPSLEKIIQNKSLENRVIFCRNLTEQKLAEYYRGANAVVFPSLYEGFGLPVVEAMASGVPALTSNTTSLPEIAGEAALLVDPHEADAITKGIEKITQDSALRNELIEKGLKQARLFSWDNVASKVQTILDSVSQ